MAILAAGTAFARVALSAYRGSEKAQRNTTQANIAYETILRFKTGASLSKDEEDIIESELARLRDYLRQLAYPDRRQ